MRRVGAIRRHVILLEGVSTFQIVHQMHHKSYKPSCSPPMAPHSPYLSSTKLVPQHNELVVPVRGQFLQAVHHWRVALRVHH